MKIVACCANRCYLGWWYWLCGHWWCRPHCCCHHSLPFSSVDPRLMIYVYSILYKQWYSHFDWDVQFKRQLDGSAAQWSAIESKREAYIICHCSCSFGKNWIKLCAFAEKFVQIIFNWINDADTIISFQSKAAMCAFLPSVGVTHTLSGLELKCHSFNVCLLSLSLRQFGSSLMTKSPANPPNDLT